MEQNLEQTLKDGENLMNDSISHLAQELTKVRTGKASTSILDGLMVEYYGTPTALNQVANLSTPDSRTIAIQPWEKSMLEEIEKAIFGANLGLTPMNDGEYVRISIPPLTEERRKLLVKQTHQLGEEAKVSLRNARQKMMEAIKTEVKNGYPEDAGKREEGKVENITKAFAKKVDDLVAQREKDILTI